MVPAAMSKIAWRVAWLSYVVLGLVMETVAVALSAPGDTLSEATWWLLDLISAQPWGFLGVAVFSITMFGSMAWASLHFVQKLIARGKL